MIITEDIAAKKATLEKVRSELKRDFFGIDDQIDKIIDTIKTWYIMPQLFDRPLIINLWGLTGVGKTSLVRQLIAGLGFADRFLEMQMGGDVTGGSYWSKNSVFEMLRQSKIKEGEPGIILFDEFQRFRTIDEHGTTIKSKEFQDIWQLLSDGRTSKDFTLYKTLDNFTDFSFGYDSDEVDEDDEDDEDEKEFGTINVTFNEKGEVKEYAASSNTDPKTGLKKAKTKPKMQSYYARQLSEMLDGSYTPSQILKKTREEIEQIIKEYVSGANTLIDYSKCLCIISGNLDEAFKNADNVNDADTDADYFFEYSKSISIFQIKNALQRRFKAEQIARLGNNNVIYPSLNKKAYTNIIIKECNAIVKKAQEISGLSFNYSDSLITTIYDNSVFPSQGTRPVFSSIHQLFGSQMAEAMLWGIESGVDTITIGIENGKIIYSNGDNSISFPVELQMKERRAKYSQSYKTVVAVHEAGHALAHTALKRMAPFEIKINATSWAGGYNIIDNSNIIQTKDSYEQSIMILLAGRAAEELIFGNNNASDGAANDFKNATVLASNYVRKLGFYGLHAVHSLADQGECVYVRDTDDTDNVIIDIVNKCYLGVSELLRNHKTVLLSLSNRLIECGTLGQDEYTEFMEEALNIKLIKKDAQKLETLVDYDGIFRGHLDAVLSEDLANLLT